MSVLHKIDERYGGPEYPGRRAVIFRDITEGKFIVKFYQKRTIEELVDERDMVTDGVKHSLTYAEDAAENFVKGYGEFNGR